MCICSPPSFGSRVRTRRLHEASLRSACCGVLLLGLLALRRTRSIAVATSVVVLGGLTPWLFELGRVAYDTALVPFFVASLLVSLEWALRSQRGSSSARSRAFALAGIAYGYAAGRLLAPLFAAALVVFAGRGRWRWLFAVWALLGIGLVRLGIYWWMHPAALTARFDQTKFIQEGQGFWSILGQTIENYLMTSISGTGPCLAIRSRTSTRGAPALRKRGRARGDRRHRRRPAAAGRPFRAVRDRAVSARADPSALSEDRFNFAARRGAAADPRRGDSGSLIVQTVRVSRLARAVAAAMIVAVGTSSPIPWQYISWPCADGSLRGRGTADACAGVRPRTDGVHRLRRSLRADTCAVVRRLARDVPVARFDSAGRRHSAGRFRFLYRFQTCDFACTEIERWNDFWLARSKEPKAS